MAAVPFSTSPVSDAVFVCTMLSVMIPHSITRMPAQTMSATCGAEQLEFESHQIKHGIFLLTS